MRPGQSGARNGRPARAQPAGWTGPTSAAALVAPSSPRGAGEPGGRQVSLVGRGKPRGGGGLGTPGAPFLSFAFPTSPPGGPRNFAAPSPPGCRSGAAEGGGARGPSRWTRSRTDSTPGPRRPSPAPCRPLSPEGKASCQSSP